jgi:hypothetical protein
MWECPPRVNSKAFLLDMKQRVKEEAQHDKDMDGRTISRCWRKERRPTVHILY